MTVPLVLTFNAGEVASLAIVFSLLGVLLSVWRIRTRINQMKKLGIADWLVIPPVILMIAMSVLTIYGVAKKLYGHPIPVDDIDFEDMADADKVFWFIQWMQPLAVGFIKLSFIFFYRSIFNVGQTTSAFNIITLVSIALIAVWTIGFTMSSLLICPGHVSAYWSETDARTDFCWNTMPWLYAISWSDVGTDLLVLVLPIPPILRLHMQTRKKIAVAGIFALGVITLLASITRAAFFSELLHAEVVDPVEDLESLDNNMLDTNGVYWLLLETGLALIAVNLPLLYGVAAKQGLGTIVRFARSFGSLRSRGSQPGGHSSLASSVNNLHKTGSESGETSIELVPSAHSR